MSLRKYLTKLTTRREYDPGLFAASTYVGDTLLEQKPSFCAPCTIQRQYSDANNRVEALLSPLYCSVCKTQHPRIFFDPPNRFEPESVRACVNATVPALGCAHKSVYLPQVDISKRNEAIKGLKSREISCPELRCQQFNCRLSLSRVSGDKPIFRYTKTWTMPTHTGPATSSGRAVLLYIIGQTPDLVCSHMAASYANFFDMKSIQDRETEPNSGIHKISCLVCAAQVTMVAPNDDKRKHSISFRQSVEIDLDNLCDGSWTAAMSLSMAGLDQDPEQKYITWCPTSFCNTSRRRERLGVLLKHAHGWMKLKQIADLNGGVFEGQRQLDLAMEKLYLEHGRQR